MNPATADRMPHWASAFAAIAILATAALLGSCGGGVGSGGTGSFASGPVSGFGSVFVGGVEFGDAQAAVFDDDGNALGGTAAAVRLGMTVEVQGGEVSSTPSGSTAAASTIRLARLAVGPVAAIDPANRSLTVLGQTLTVDDSTVLDPALAGGMAGLRIGDSVSAYALADALGHPVATRIEPASAGEPWRLRGFATSVNAAAKRLTIGSAQLDYSAALDVPAGLASGQFVHVRISGAGAGGAWPVERFLPATEAPGDAARALVEGVVAAPVPGVSIRVGALSVDTRGATVSPAGAALTAGSQVQIEGHLQGGSFVAETITVVAAGGAAKRVYQLVGTAGSLDTVAQTFVLRGVGVDYSAAKFVNGSIASLSVPNTTVRVQGPLSADGERVEATTILLP